MAAGILTCRYDFTRVAVVQLFQAKVATPGDIDRGIQQCLWKFPAQLLACLQVALAIGDGAVAQFGHCAAMAYGCQHIVQHAS